SAGSGLRARRRFIVRSTAPAAERSRLRARRAPGSPWSLSTRAPHYLDERRELLAATGAEPLVSAGLLEPFRDRAALGPNLGVLRHERQEVVAVDLDVARLA